MLLGTLGGSLLGNLLTGEGPGFLIPPHPLTNFEIQKYFQNEPEFNGVYLRSNLAKIKNVTHVINLHEFKSIGTHWMALYVINNNVTYFNSFEIEHITKEIKKFIRNKNIITNIFRIQAHDLMCGYFYIGFVDFMLEGQRLLDYTNFFSPNKYEKNDKIILKYFQ